MLCIQICTLVCNQLDCKYIEIILHNVNNLKYILMISYIFFFFYIKLRPKDIFLFYILFNNTRRQLPLHTLDTFFKTFDEINNQKIWFPAVNLPCVFFI